MCAIDPNAAQWLDGMPMGVLLVSLFVVWLVGREARVSADAAAESACIIGMELDAHPLGASTGRVNEQLMGFIASLRINGAEDERCVAVRFVGRGCDRLTGAATTFITAAGGSTRSIMG